MHTDERVLKAFGRELRRLRGESELTQRALARRISRRGTAISESHVSDIENDRVMARPWQRKFLDEVLESDGRLDKLGEELTGSGRQVRLHEVTKRTHAADASSSTSRWCSPPTHRRRNTPMRSSVTGLPGWRLARSER